MLYSCLTLAISLAVISYTDGSDDLDILHSDPQYILQELTRFQSELQEMLVRYNTQNTKLVDLQTKYDIQNTNLSDLQILYNTLNTTLAEHQVKYDTQKTNLTDLQTKYNTQNTKLSQLQDKYNDLNAKLSELHGVEGAVFTRWGRRDCPANKTTTVYSGNAGGSHYTHTGAAVDYLCMPNDPIWGPHKDLMYNDSVGYVYGAEYQDPASLFGMPKDGEYVPCAVCLGTKHTASVMIPGRTQCYPGWTEVYHGDLASGYPGHPAASQYVCVDGDAESLPGGGITENGGKLFYGVKAECGALPCPPYENEKFLPCVVCMK